jgi:hypothetical protein
MLKSLSVISKPCWLQMLSGTSSQATLAHSGGSGGGGPWANAPLLSSRRVAETAASVPAPRAPIAHTGPVVPSGRGDSLLVIFVLSPLSRAAMGNSQPSRAAHDAHALLAAIGAL